MTNDVQLIIKWLPCFGPVAESEKKVSDINQFESDH